MGETLISLYCVVDLSFAFQEAVWIEGTDDDGHTYYYNIETGGERFYSGPLLKTQSHIYSTRNV